MDSMNQIVLKFPEVGEVESIKPLTSGLINQTYLVRTADKAAADYILQCINHNIFTDVEMLQHNIEAVTAHIRKKLEAAGEDDIDRKVLRFAKTAEGKTYYFDGEKYWRMCRAAWPTSPPASLPPPAPTRERWASSARAA